MNVKKIKKFYPLILIGIFVLILFINFFNQLALRKQPPSKVWGKEVVISNGYVKMSTSIKKFGDNYLIAHNDENNIKLILLNKQGEKLNEKQISCSNKFLMSFALTKDTDDYIYVSRLYCTKTKNISTIKLNKDLKEVAETSTENTNDLEGLNELDDENILIIYKNKLEVKNVLLNTSSYIYNEQAENIGIAQTHNKTLITYINTNSGYLKYFYYDHGKITVPKSVMPIKSNNTLLYYSSPMTIVDKNDVYAFFLISGENIPQDDLRFGSGYVKFSLNGQAKTSFKSLKFIDYADIKEMVPIKSKEGIRFLGTSFRNYGMKKYNEDVIDFTIKDGSIKSYNFVSRSERPSLFQSTLDNIVVYADNNFYNTEKSCANYDICITSSEDTYKNTHNNIVTFKEKKQALSDCIENISKIAPYILLSTLLILGIVFIAYGICFLFEYKIKDSHMYILLIILCILASLFKIKFLKVYYFSNTLLSILAMVIISFLCYTYSYLKFKNNDTLPIFLVLLPMTVLDVILSFLFLLSFIV